MRIAFLLLPLALASLPPNHPAYRRHHAKLIARANGTDTDTGGGGSSSSTSSPSTEGPTSSFVPPSSTTPPPPPSSSSTRPSSSDPPTTTTSADDTSSADTSSQVTSSTPSTSATSAAISSIRSSVSQSRTSAIDTDIVSSPSNSRSAGSRTVVRTATASASASKAAKDSEEDSNSGLPKGALIAIIVCSVVIGVGGIAWTLFRKWKLKPSKGFDQRMQPVDFSPNNTDMGDDFFEKTMARDADAERQRQQFCIELDNDAQKDATLVSDLQHDFTAGPATGGYGYQPSPYNNNNNNNGSQNYDFSTPRQDWNAGATGYPPQQGGAYFNDYPTQDAPDQQHSAHGHGSYADHSQHGHAGGYADLQRGPSVGHAPAPIDFGSDFAISGRPTDGSAGPSSPYAQAATYRY